MPRYLIVILLAGMLLVWSCSQIQEKNSDTAERAGKAGEEKLDKTVEPEQPEKSSGAVEKTKEEIVSHPSKLEFPPLEFEPPKPSDYRIKLDNGMIVYIAEDSELPTFDMEIKLRTGSMYESSDKVGLAAMCGALLRKGGTTSMTGEEIDEYMAQIAGSLNTGIGFSSASVSLSVLKEDTDKGLKMLADVLMNPVFEEDEIRRYKERVIQGLEHRYDRPGSMLRDTYDILLYGGHPVARISCKSSINAILRQDLLNFHETYFNPGNCIVAVAGDFKKEEMIKKLEELFADWETKEIEFPEVPDVEMKFEKGVYIVEKDINQGYVRIGHLGIRDDNPDKYAVRIMNAILGGGGFTSRITSRVRSDEGLAYSVGSGFSIPVDYTGAFSCSFQTKSESVAYAVSIVTDEINRIRTELVSEDDLQRAKDLFVERFPSIFSGRGSAAYARVQALADNEFSRRPMDYFDKYRDNYSRITREKVLEVAKKYLRPDSLKIVVVGKADSMVAGDGKHEVKLEDFGKITKLEPPDVLK